MLILLASVFAMLLLLSFVFAIAHKYYNSHWNGTKNDGWYTLGKTVDMFDFDSAFGFIGGIGLSLTLIVMLFVGIGLSNSMVIDDKIAMYEQENAAINEEVNLIVSDYKEHELDVFDAVTEDISPVVVFSLYPELKSNTLVSKQIDTYIANQEEIKFLKTKKLNYKVCKWWLCF